MDQAGIILSSSINGLLEACGHEFKCRPVIVSFTWASLSELFLCIQKALTRI